MRATFSFWHLVTCGNMIPKDVRDRQIELAAVIQSAIQTMPRDTVMLFEFTMAEYHHIVIKKIAEAQRIHLVNIDDSTILPYYQISHNTVRMQGTSPGYTTRAGDGEQTINQLLSLHRITRCHAGKVSK